MDVVDFREFYAGPLGRAASRQVTAALQPMLKPLAGQSVLGLGFATPYLDRLVPDECPSLAFMLARLGVIHWPRHGGVRSALVDEADLPLLESSIDHVLVAHGLEHAETPLEMLQEIWRVMAPQGRLYLVVPNRLGFWAAADSSPFGHGQPFSRSQLSALLKEAQFTVVQWQHALFMPPVRRKAVIQSSAWLERAGAFGFKRFSGVIIVEAMKQVYAFSSGKRARRLVPRLRPALLPAPQPARKTSTTLCNSRGLCL